MKSHRLLLLAILVLISIPISWWCYRINDQNNRLDQAEKLVPKVMLFIQNGSLLEAKTVLTQSEHTTKIIQNEWAAWPSIRTRERNLTAHLANLRAAYSIRLTLVESTSTKVVEYLKKGQLGKAAATVSAAITDQHKDDRSLKQLSLLVEGLCDREFKAAAEAAKRTGSWLKEQGAFSEATNTTLSDLTMVAEDEETRFNEKLSVLLSKISECLKSGQFDIAAAMISKAMNDNEGDDHLLKVLSHLVKRLEAQDFFTATEAVEYTVKYLKENSTSIGATNTSLSELSRVVESEKTNNYTVQERIANKVKHLIDNRSCLESSDFHPFLRGKAMIWDTTKNEVEEAYKLLPDDLRASSRDGIITIFSVIARDQIFQGNYSKSGQPGYKEKMTIGVVYWPEEKSAGTAVVWGGDPPIIRPVSYVPSYGSSINIMHWVKELPRETREMQEKRERLETEKRERLETEKREKMGHLEREELENTELLERVERKNKESLASAERQRNHALRVKFSQPRPGSPIVLEFERGGKLEGTLISIDDNSLQILKGTSTLNVDRETLSNRCKANLYLDDFMTYNLKEMK